MKIGWEYKYDSEIDGNNFILVIVTLNHQKEEN